MKHITVVGWSPSKDMGSSGREEWIKSFYLAKYHVAWSSVGRERSKPIQRRHREQDHRPPSLMTSLVPCFPGGSGTVSAQACQIKPRRPASFEFQIKHKSLNMCIMKYLAILCPYLLNIQPKFQSHSCQHSPLSLQFPRRWSFEEALSYYWAGPGGETQILFQSDLLWPGLQSHQPIIVSWSNNFWCKETTVVLQWAKVIDRKADRGEWEAMR